MTTTEQKYNRALSYIKNLPKDDSKIDNQTKLKFYALFKQITEGQNKTKAPSKLKIVEKYKWDAWKKLGKMSKQAAMKEYINCLAKIVPNWDTPKPKL